MSNFFGNRRLFVLLISMIMLISLMGLTFGERATPTWPEKFVRDTTSLAQSILYKPAHAVSDFFENIQHMYNIYEENQTLKANLDRLTQLSAEVKKLKEDNEHLRSMLGAKARYHDYRLKFADVVSRSPDRWNNVIVINLGSRDGVKAGMAVITPQGMIGRIQSASNFSSQVELLTDIERGSYISAIVQGKREIYGVVEGYEAEKNLFIMRKIPLDAEIEVDQTVITSGLGGTIPPGLVIGKVVDVVPGDYGLTQIAYIKTSADLYRLSEVFVVERFTGEMPSDSQQGSEEPDGTGQEEESE